MTAMTGKLARSGNGVRWTFAGGTVVHINAAAAWSGRRLHGGQAHWLR